jgi:hypothetical protein
VYAFDSVWREPSRALARPPGGPRTDWDATRLTERPGVGLDIELSVIVFLEFGAGRLARRTGCRPSWLSMTIPRFL